MTGRKPSPFPEVEQLLVNVARAYSWISMYRSDHPTLIRRMETVYGALSQGIAREPSGRLLLGIAKDKVFYQNEFLGEDQPLVRRLTETLFLSKVATIEFSRDLRPEDLLSLFRAIHQAATERTGESVETLLKKQPVCGIRLYPYNYRDVLSRRIVSQDEGGATADREDDLWRMLLTENIDEEPGGANILEELRGAPELIPAILRRARAATAVDPDAPPAGEADTVPPELVRKLVGRLGEIVCRLPADRKGQFLEQLASGFDGACRDAEDPASLESLLGASLSDGRTDEELLDLIGAVLSAEDKGGKRLRKVFGIIAAGRNRDDALLSKARERVHESLRTKNYFAQKTWETVESFLLGRSEEAYLGQDHAHLLEALSSLGDAPAAAGAVSVPAHPVAVEFSDEALHRKSTGILLELLAVDDTPDEEFHGILEDFRKIIPNTVSRKEFALLGSLLSALAGIGRQLREERKAAIQDVIATADFAHVIDIYLSPDLAADGKEHIRNIIVSFAEAAMQGFLDRLLIEPEKGNRRALMDVAFRFGPQAVPALVERLDDPRWYLVRNLCIILGEIGDARAVPGLLRAVEHPRFHVQREAIAALGKLAAPDATPVLGKILLADTLLATDQDDALRIVAANALFRCGPRGVSYVHRALSCRRAAVREHCRSLLPGEPPR